MTKSYAITVCPRSLDAFYIESYYNKNGSRILEEKQINTCTII